MKKILIATAVLVTLAIGVFTIANAQSGWELIDTGYDHILYDMSFPEGQSEIGFAVGSTSTYNGDGIILKTEDGGDSWEQISGDDIPGLEACFFTDLNTGYVGGWDNYFAKTTDGGESWTEIEVNPTIWFIIDMEFWDENNGIVAAWGAMVFVTDDAGESWTQATGLSDVQDLAYASGDVLYACGGDENIHKSTDGGLTWSEIYSGWFQYMFLGVEFLNEDYGFVGGEDGKIMMTEDGGDTWTENNSSFFHLWHGFHIFNEDSAYVAGTPEGVYKTTDGGITWVDDYPESNFDIAFYKVLFTAEDNTGFICGSQGTIMRKESPDPLPAASVTPTEIVYPETIVGETAEESITISNTGNAMLSVSNISSDATVFYPELTAVDIAPGNSETIAITFAPDDEGSFVGILTIECNDPVNPLIEVSLEGEGIYEMVPAANVSTEEIVYPQTWVGEIATYIVTIGNTGNALLMVSNIESDNAVFYPNIASLEVAAGDAQEVTVSFEPDDEGLFEGMLTISCNDPLNPVFEIDLQGDGILPMAVISVDDELQFDTTLVNNTSTQTLEVWNIGNVILDVTSVNTSSASFDVDISSFTVEPGEYQNIEVSFTPDAQGDYSEALEIMSNDAGSPAIINLYGYGALETGLFETKASTLTLNAYPNPFNQHVIIRSNTKLNESRTLKIFNMVGGLVKEIIVGTSGSAKSEYVWKGENESGDQVPAGIYFGVMENGDSKQSIKLIKR